MDPRNFVVILLAFCTTLLLGFGISIVYGATGVDICKEAYCYVIRDFIQFYRTVFFIFGISLTITAIIGFMGLVLKKKKMLGFYARLLVLILVGILVILCAGIWVKGPVQLRVNLFNAIRTYGQNCRTIASVDQLQTQFKCCGIDRPEDWSYIYNKTSLEPPMSCCSLNMLYESEEDGLTQCINAYSNGCLFPLRQLFWRFFNIVVMLAAVIALKSTVSIICTYKLMSSLESISDHMLSQQNLIAASVITPMNIVYHSDDSLVKEYSSTAV